MQFVPLYRDKRSEKIVWIESWKLDGWICFDLAGEILKTKLSVREGNDNNRQVSHAIESSRLSDYRKD